MHEPFCAAFECSGDDIVRAMDIGSGLALVVMLPRAEIGGRMKNGIYFFRHCTLDGGDIGDVADHAADVKTLSDK